METAVDRMLTLGAGPESAAVRGDGGHVLSDAMKRHFRENYPVLLDGALSPSPISGFFLRQARQALSKRGDEQRIMSSAILRETLESVIVRATPSTRAGLTAVGPRRARVWWDPKAIGDLDDIIAGLTRPRPVLRFHDVTGIDPKTGRWNNVFDIDVDFAEKGRTVDFWAADRSYIVDLGFIHADGIFVRLARTNLAALPREGRGEAAGDATARTEIAARASSGRSEIIPDAAAREWAAERRDHPGRDLEAELVIHMLYRAFLTSGPRALRSAPHLFRRDPAVLRQEFIQRGRRRDRRMQAARSSGAPRLLVADLGTLPSRSAVQIAYPPVPFVAAPFRTDVTALSGISADEFRFFRDVAAMAMSGREYRVVSPDLVRPAAPRKDASPSPMAVPVFEAAEKLRRRLAQIPPAPPASAGRGKASPVLPRIAAGGDGARLAGAGVRFTRMALTLEGRMRPGARLRVAGKLVEADAEGRFRLECTLSGAKSSIPLRAGSRAGEVRSLVNVEWSRAPRKRGPAAAPSQPPH